MRSALALVNDMLSRFALPPFSASGLPAASRQSVVSDAAPLRVPGGAIFTRVDMAENYETGPDCPAVIRALSQGIWHGKKCRQYGDTGLQWGSRRHTLIKWYAKGAEMACHNVQATDESDIEYRNRLIDWAKKTGLLRFEIQLGRDTLRRHGLRHLGEWSDDRAVRVMTDIKNKMLPSVGAGGLSDISDELISMGYTEVVSARMQGLAYQWAAGVDVFSQYRPATAYKYRSILRGVGIDIRQPLRDVTALRVQPRVVDLRTSSAPSWYRYALAS
jgi:hypothetical protein